MKADGVTDDSHALQDCKTSAVSSYGSRILVPCGQILLKSSQDFTNLLSSAGGIEIAGCGKNTNANAYTPGTTEFLFPDDLANPGFDFTGTANVRLHDLSIRGGLVQVLFGRDHKNGNQYCFSQFNRIDNVEFFPAHSPAANSNWGGVAIYSIGAEHWEINNSRAVANTGAWFSYSNDLNVTSAYQKLQTGCPTSETLSKFDTFSVTQTSSTGAGIVLNGVSNFTFINQHFIANRDITSYALLLGAAGNNSTIQNVKLIGAQVEHQNAPAAFMKISPNVTGLSAEFVTAGGSGASNGYLQFGTGSPSCTSCYVRGYVANGTAQPLIDKSARGSFVGSVLDFGNTLSPYSNKNMTLQGTLVIAPHHKPGDLSFNGGSVIPWLFSLGGVENRGGIVNGLQLNGATSGFVSIGPVAVAGSNRATLPANTGTIAELNLEQTWTAAQTFNQINAASLLISNSAPTVLSGFGSSPLIIVNNGTLDFRVNVGAGGTATGGVIGLPRAAQGWDCDCEDRTTFSTTVFKCRQTADTTTSATVGNFNSSAAPAAWVAGDILAVTCRAR